MAAAKFSHKREEEVLCAKSVDVSSHKEGQKEKLRMCGTRGALGRLVIYHIIYTSLCYFKFFIKKRAFLGLFFVYFRINKQTLQLLQ